MRRGNAKAGAWVSETGALAVCGLAVVTNYVTSEVPGWADNPWLVWGVFAVLVVVSVGDRNRP